jgi:hypothetical protein
LIAGSINARRASWIDPAKYPPDCQQVCYRPGDPSAGGLLVGGEDGPSSQLARWRGPRWLALQEVLGEPLGRGPYACKHGLKSNPQVLGELPYLSEIHKNHVARYPKSPGQIWLASEFDDAVDALLADTWQHIRVV